MIIELECIRANIYIVYLWSLWEKQSLEQKELHLS